MERLGMCCVIDWHGNVGYHKQFFGQIPVKEIWISETISKVYQMILA